MSAVSMLGSTGLGSTGLGSTHTLLAAEPDSSGWVGPGLLGFIVIVLLGLATFLLWRNMNKQLGKVDFDDGSGERGDEPNGPENSSTDSTNSTNDTDENSSPRQP